MSASQARPHAVRFLVMPASQARPRAVGSAVGSKTAGEAASCWCIEGEAARGRLRRPCAVLRQGAGSVEKQPPEQPSVCVDENDDR